MNFDALKGLLLSKTFWVNALATLWFYADWLLANFGVVTQIAPSAANLLPALTALNVVLRVATNKPLDEKTSLIK